MAQHDSTKLITLFEKLFFKSYNTRLMGGAQEPVYQPANKDGSAIIYFRDNYFSSALHEIAHWCIAGDERRNQVDYGYWYNADNRDNTQQKAFFNVEVKPQSLEWMFSVASGYSFEVSLDNVNASENTDWSYWEQLAVQKSEFKLSCYQQIATWFNCGIPRRGNAFITTLINYYRPHTQLKLSEFILPETMTHA